MPTYSVDDTYLAQAASTTNYSTATTMKLRDANVFLWRPLIQVPLLEVLPIQSAILTLRTNSAVSEPVTGQMTFETCRCNEQPVNSQATWDDRATATAWTTAGGSIDAPSATHTLTSLGGDELQEIDCTNVLQRCYEMGDAISSFIIKFVDETVSTANDQLVSFYSTNDSQEVRRPVLEVTYGSAVKYTRTRERRAVIR